MTDVNKQLERAKKFLEKNRTEDAIDAYLAVLEDAPSHPEATQALGDLYARQEQPGGHLRPEQAHVHPDARQRLGPPLHPRLDRRPLVVRECPLRRPVDRAALVSFLCVRRGSSAASSVWRRSPGQPAHLGRTDLTQR